MVGQVIVSDVLLKASVTGHLWNTVAMEGVACRRDMKYIQCHATRGLATVEEEDCRLLSRCWG